MQSSFLEPSGTAGLPGRQAGKIPRRRRLSFVHVVLGLVLVMFAFSTVRAAGQKDGFLHVYFLNIGQGDAIFIQAPNGNQVLVDGGPDGRVLQELGRVMPFYDSTIDAVVVSHPHSDHISGLIDVFDHYEVGAVIQAQELYDSGEFRAWQQVVRAEGAHEVPALLGTVLDLGNEVTLTILYPFHSAAGVMTKTPHDHVVVAMLRYGQTEILLTGDMEDDVERKLILQNIDVRADVLKVGHHGSKTSTLEEFLTAVSPQAAVIQVGANNRYKHPTPEVLSRLEQYGIPYYRNDIDGVIEAVSDGETVVITTSNSK